MTLRRRGHASLRVDLTGAGTTVTLALGGIRQIGRTSVTARPPVRGSGTDVSLDAETLTRSPAGGNLPNLLVQLPGAARGANGVVHINGDHGDINYIVDGVQVPQELNRTVGTEFDPNDIAFVEALQGAYPAQYGERFASVINIDTRTRQRSTGLRRRPRVRLLRHLDATVGYHTTLGKGSLVAAVRDERSDRGLDPPNFDSPHDALQQREPVRAPDTLPTRAELPEPHRQPLVPDLPDSAPTSRTARRPHSTTTRPKTTCSRRPVPPPDRRPRLALVRALVQTLANPRLRRPANDFAFGAAQNPGAPTDCALALRLGTVVNGVVTNPANRRSLSNGTCAFSLSATAPRSTSAPTSTTEPERASTTSRFGGLYDATHVTKDVRDHAAAGNFLAPIFTPGDTRRGVHRRRRCAQHRSPQRGVPAGQLEDGPGLAARLRPARRLFVAASTEFRAGFGQVSPRVKLTRFFGARDSVYAYYGRFFTPFSLENVSPGAAYRLNLPLQAAPAQFDLRPQRDSVYELGGHFALGRGDLGLRVMQKNATDLIDDTQVGDHQPAPGHQLRAGPDRDPDRVLSARPAARRAASTTR